VNKERELKIKGRPTKAMAIVRKIDAGSLTAEEDLFTVFLPQEY